MSHSRSVGQEARLGLRPASRSEQAGDANATCAWPLELTVEEVRVLGLNLDQQALLAVMMLLGPQSSGASRNLEIRLAVPEEALGMPAATPYPDLCD